MKCPSCFFPMPPMPAFGVCQGSCRPEPQTWGAERVRGYDVVSPTIFQVDGALSPCPKCSGPAGEACGHCGYHIPAACRDRSGEPRHGTFLTFVGARATGKSLLIATMIQQFRLLATRFWQFPLTAVGTTQARFEAAYLTPLFIQRQVMQSTPELAMDSPSREPLVFVFRAPGPEGTLTDRVLVVRDVAGEDLEGLGQRSMEAFEFFARADAVISLIDPLKVPQIEHYLSGLVTPADQLGGDGVAVLDHVLRAIDAGMRHSEHPGGGPALGIALSKFDLMQRLAGVQAHAWPEIMGRAGAAFQRDPSLSRADYDLVDADLLHHEVYGLLRKLGVQSVLGMATTSGLNYRYFAVSALGDAPAAASLSPLGIVPFRVLDPLKWALTGLVVAQ